MNASVTTSPVTIWYGERGIINSIVTHIASLNNPSIAVSKLLDAVEWADAGKPAWISRITKVNMIIEISLSDFGNPDLMIVCRVKEDDLPYCVFVEAKTTCYQFSMGDNSKGMSPGYNSTINGQLSLKYRFAKALENPGSNNKEIVEPKLLFTKYKNKIEDYNQNPRHLKKSSVLNILNILGLLKLKEERCHYVALTWDNPQHAFFNDPDVKSPHNLPLLLDESGNDVFSAIKPRIGWLGYKNLEVAIKLKTNVEYNQACISMFDNSEPTQNDYDKLRSGVVFPDEIFLNELYHRFAKASGCNPPKFGHKKHKGSISICVDGNPLAKIIPGDRIFVGVRCPCPKQGLSVQQNPSNTKRINGVVFQGIYLESNDNSIDLDILLKDILDDFKERCSL